MAEEERTAGNGRKPASYRYGGKLPAESEMLEELLKATEIQELFESYYNLITIPVAIIDLNANVLLSSRWQRICTEFHRVDPVACRRCIESDTSLALQLQEGRTYTIYRCHNGLTDCASPIVIEGKHVANLFIGQFLMEDADEERFRKQAEEFGFDVAAYLAALREVPVVDGEKIPVILDLLARITRVITNLGIERKRAIESQHRQSILLDTIPQSVFWKDRSGRYLGCNAAFARAAGLASPEEIAGKTDFDLPWPRKEAVAYRADDEAVISSGVAKRHIIEPLQQADGSRIVIDTSKIPLIGAGKAPYGLVGIYEDITERRKAEEHVSEMLRFETLLTGLSAKLLDIPPQRLDQEMTETLRLICDFLDIDDSTIWQPSGRLMKLTHFYRRGEGPHVPRRMDSGNYFPWSEEQLRRGMIINIPSMALLPREAARDRNTWEHYGIRSVLIFPLMARAKELIGTLTFGMIRQERSWPEDLMNRLQLVAQIFTSLLSREQTEESLRKSEAYRRAIFDSGRDAMIILKEDRFIDCNPAALALFGAERKAFIGQPPYKKFSPEFQPDGRRSRESGREKIRGAINGRPQFFDWKHRRLDGTLFDAEVSLSRVRLEGEEVLVQAVVRDVSERKRAENELHRLNRELRAISDCNEVLVRAEKESTLLADICTTVCEKAGYRMAWVGYAENDAGKSVRPVAWAGAEEGYLTGASITWADNERGRGPTGTAIRGCRTVCVQDFASDPRMAPWRDNALGHGYHSSIALPLKDSLGTPFGAFTVYSSETNAFTTEEIRLLEELAEDLAFGVNVLRARKVQAQTEAARHASETRFRAIFENSRDGICVSIAGIIVYANPATFALFGEETEEGLEGKSFISLIAPGSRDEIQEIALLASQGLDAPPLYETRGLKADGTEFDMEIQTARYELNGQWYSVAQMRDVTERKELEQQLRQAQKMEAVGTLAGGIAHDFNNILTAIIGFGSLLEMKMDPSDRLRRNVEQILTAADRASNLTRSLLAFSRSEPMKSTVVDLNSIVTRLETILRRLIREDIELGISLCSDPLPVLADAGQIEQVLINLTTNARDALPGKGRISLRSCSIELDEAFTKAVGIRNMGSYALITFRDTGTGMTEDVRQRIFDPFFTTKEVGKGTGLGLAICYGIVNQHQGYICCESELGLGTTFRIYLPLAQGSAEPAEAEVPAPLPGGTETILVAEDDATVRELTVSLLTEFGYRVIEAADGAEAIARFGEQPDQIALCLFDMIMPKKNGGEALEEIRRLRPDVPALFISGHQSDAFREQILTQARVDFLPKPVAPGDLLRRVRQVLEG